MPSPDVASPGVPFPIFSGPIRHTDRIAQGITTSTSNEHTTTIVACDYIAGHRVVIRIFEEQTILPVAQVGISIEVEADGRVDDAISILTGSTGDLHAHGSVAGDHTSALLGRITYDVAVGIDDTDADTVRLRGSARRIGPNQIRADQVTIGAHLDATAAETIDRKATNTRTGTSSGEQQTIRNSARVLAA